MPTRKSASYRRLRKNVLKRPGARKAYEKGRGLARAMKQGQQVTDTPAKPKKLQILDDRGRPAPRVKAAELGRYPGKVLKLADRRGVAVISSEGRDIAVMLSLAEFWRLLFNFALRSSVSLEPTKASKRKMLKTKSGASHKAQPRR